jgi:UDP-N-acetylenolpyruvoylglucosamine reductase
MNRNLKVRTARDVLELIALPKARAKETRGIKLHTEVEFIGEEIV